ncbi:MAG: BatD family protein [Haliscomenobacter sp.]
MRAAIFLGLLFLWMPLVQAQKTVHFSASASSDTVWLGHYFKLTFTLKNGQGSKFTPPSFGSDVEWLSGPNTSTSISVVNGETTREQSFSYLVRPTTVGVLRVLPATIETEEGLLETESFAISVLPNEAGLPQPAVDRRSDLFRMDFGDRLPGWSLPPSAQEEAAKKKRKTVKI